MWGGDEFVILLSDTDANGAMVVAERIRAKVSELCLEIAEKIVKMTVSIGVTGYEVEDRSLDDSLKRAEEGLSQAKRSGRNKTVFVGAELKSD